MLRSENRITRRCWLIMYVTSRLFSPRRRACADVVRSLIRHVSAFPPTYFMASDGKIALCLARCSRLGFRAQAVRNAGIVRGWWHMDVSSVRMLHTL